MGLEPTTHCLMTDTLPTDPPRQLSSVCYANQGNTTNLNISFRKENENRAVQVGLEPTTHCLMTDTLPTDPPRQLSSVCYANQGNTTNLNISFRKENENRAVQVGLEPTTHCLMTDTLPTDPPRQLSSVCYANQGNTTNLNISFRKENENRAVQVGLEPTTHCLMTDTLPTDPPRQLSSVCYAESGQYY